MERKILKDLKLGDSTYKIYDFEVIEQKNSVNYLKLSHDLIITNNYSGVSQYPFDSIMYNNYYINKEDAEFALITIIEEEMLNLEKEIANKVKKLTNLEIIQRTLNSKYSIE